jgi:hypothetical protein
VAKDMAALLEQPFSKQKKAPQASTSVENGWKTMPK